MHAEQIEFTARIKGMYPDYFVNKRILDCGSLDINGSNRGLFTNCDYKGVDIGEGKNVDIVSPIHELDFEDETFDVIISTECLEHDPFHEYSIQNMLRMLKKGGLMVLTCATTGRPEHGTERTSPQDSPHTSKKWPFYYKNLTIEDVIKSFGVDDPFIKYDFETNKKHCDLYFWGIKSK